MLTRTAASARRRAQRGRRDRGAAELLPQQRAAPVHGVGVDRAVLPATTGACRAPAVLRLGRTIYPFLQGASCSCRGTRTSSPSASTAPSTCSSREGLLHAGQRGRGRHPRAQRRARPTRCSACARSAHSLQQAFERYYIAISVLVKNGPRHARRRRTGNACASSPRNACRCCTRRRRRNSSTSRCSAASSRSCASCGWCGPTRTASWCSTSAWTRGRRTPSVILGRELRHTIEKVSPEAAKPVASSLPAASAVTRADQAGSSGISADSSLAMQSFSCSLRFFRRLIGQFVGVEVGLQRGDRDVEVAMFLLQRR